MTALSRPSIPLAEPVGYTDRDRPITVGELDETYVALCLLDGGFPRAVVAGGRTYLVYPESPTVPV